MHALKNKIVSGFIGFRKGRLVYGLKVYKPRNSVKGKGQQQETPGTSKSGQGENKIGPILSDQSICQRGG